MKISACCIIALTTLLLVPTGTRADILWAGEPDFFGGTSEPALPSPELDELLSEFQGTQDFDLIPGVNGGYSNRQVAHTFTDLPFEITEATLDMRLSAGTTYGSTNDGIFLSFASGADTTYAQAIVYRRSFGAIDSIPPYYPEADPGLIGHWYPLEQAVLRLDLAALPLVDGGTLNLLPQLAATGILDVLISDDTGVDFLRLAINEPPGPTGVRIDEFTDAVRLSSAPNPFVHSTSIRFALPVRSDATIRIFEVSGRVVRTIHNGALSAGDHQVSWDGRDDRGQSVAAGVYLYRLETDRFVETRRMVRIK